MGIKEEIFGFLIAVFSGSIVRLFYQNLVCIRHIFKHKLIVIEIEDLVFWIITALYLFVQIYHTSNGSIRWSFILGIVVGALVSTIFLRKIENRLKKIYNLQMGENIAKSRKKRYYK